ncbi:MAG: acyl-CoA desaturase [Sandaracinaceae bacterium]
MSSAPNALPTAVGREADRSTSSETRHDYRFWTMWPWVLIHLLPLLAIFTGVTWQAVAVCAVLFWFRLFMVTSVYHRYFSHRTYKTSRVFQFILAFFAETTVQRGVLWWAAHHRAHHLYSDTERDIHSPEQDGFWHAHAGWLWVPANTRTQYHRIKDFAKYPELVFLDRYYLIPPIVMGTTVWLLFGWSGLLIGFFLSTVLLWHTTYVINSLCHVWGSRRYDTSDTSRNNLWLALLTMGEGWHNNHHHYMNSCRQGFYWWEVDFTYYGLKVLSWLGLVWDIKEPPPRVLEAGREADRTGRLAPSSGSNAPSSGSTQVA